jgi:hypothetical protein
MRFPVVLSVVAIGLVAFKVVTISTLVLGGLVVASVVLPFVIVGAIFFGLVSLGMLAVRFIAYCVRGPRPPVGVSPPRPAPGVARATVHAAAPPPPWENARYHWSRHANGRGYGRRRRRLSWVWVLLAIAAVCVVVNRSPGLKRMIQDHRVTRIVKSPIRHGKKLPPPPPARDDDDDSDDEPQMVEVPAAPAPSASSSAPSVVPVEPPVSSSAAIAVPVKPPTTESSPRWTVTGHGEADYAGAMALERAQQEVRLYLQQQHPKVEWIPDQDYIDQHLVKGRRNPSSTNLDGLKVEHRELDVAITPDDYRDILQHDSQYRMDQRLLWVGAGLAGLVVFFGAIAGYIRLDEWSKGYYTWWLRFGALGFLGVAGAGLMLLFGD